MISDFVKGFVLGSIISIGVAIPLYHVFEIPIDTMMYSCVKTLTKK